MPINLPKGVKQEPALKLYYKSYPFKVEITTATTRSSNFNLSLWEWYEQQRKVVDKLCKKLVANPPKEVKTTCANSFSLKHLLYCKTESDVQNVLDQLVGYSPKKHSVTVYSMTEEHVEVAKLDAKVIFRKDYYYGKYAWKLSYRNGTDSDLYDSLLAQFFTEEQIAEFNKKVEDSASRRWYSGDERSRNSISTDRAKIYFGTQWSDNLLYFVEEDDAAMARLMIGYETEITKVIKA